METRAAFSVNALHHQSQLAESKSHFAFGKPGVMCEGWLEVMQESGERVRV